MDENDVEIDKVEFESKISFDLLGVEFQRNDSVFYKLSPRWEEGSIGTEGMVLLREYLEKCTGNKYSKGQIFAIVYYPGKDPCNSSAQAFRAKGLIRSHHKFLKRNLKKLNNVELVYMFKDNKGLKAHKGIVKWHHDVDRGIEELFFIYHYPCSSYVVINPRGSYYAWFGEHSDKNIIDTAERYVLKNEKQ